MPVFYTCNKCKSENKFKTYSSTRVEFAMNHGEKLSLKCSACNYSNTLEVNDFYAKKSNLALIVAGTIAVIGTPIAFYLFYYFAQQASNYYNLYLIGGYFILPITVYGMILKQDRERVSRFNRNKF